MTRQNHHIRRFHRELIERHRLAGRPAPERIEAECANSGKTVAARTIRDWLRDPDDLKSRIPRSADDLAAVARALATLGGTQISAEALRALEERRYEAEQQRRENRRESESPPSSVEPISSEESVGASARSVTQHVVGEIPGVPAQFVERQEVYDLATALETGTVAVVCAALTGMRGVGKTHIAAAYARAQIQACCELVGWVNAENIAELVTGLAHIAAAVDVADPDGDSAASARRLRDHLNVRPGSSVLVFDNAQEPDLIRPYLPATGATRVVITSTERVFTEFGAAIDVGTFRREQSVDHLIRRTGITHTAGADRVAAELGDLPLAVASAGATIEARNIDYDRYHQLLLAYPVAKTLNQKHRGQQYKHTTYAAIRMAIEAIEDANAVAGRLLEAVMRLSHKGVHRDALHRYALNKGYAADELEVDAALERCVEGSALNWSDDHTTLIMHRLMARVLIERSDTTGRRGDSLVAALDVIDPYLTENAGDWNNRAEVDDLIGHIDTIWDDLDSDDDPDDLDPDDEDEDEADDPGDVDPDDEDEADDVAGA